MAEKNGYPRIARSAWFGIREKLKQRVPGELSPSYIATALGMTPASARTNVMPALSAFGLIDNANKPTERAFDWRDDGKYADVCSQIVEKVYPSELRDLFHTPDSSLDGIKSWFARSAKVGDAAAGKFAATYLMLLEADSTGKSNTSKTKNTASPAKTAKTAKPAKADKPKPAVTGQKQDSSANSAAAVQRTDGASGLVTPKLHIDIQIHISPESTADQIDKIFESMAKHLKDFRA